MLVAKSPTGGASTTVQAMSAEAGKAVDDGAVIDELPEDLDISQVEAPVEFPNNNRRRIPALMYLILGAAAIVLSIVKEGSPTVNNGLRLGGIALILFAVYGFVTGVRMRIDEQEAFAAASAAMDFPTGHASAQQVWLGWLSRPTWRILLYSNENPPAHRGMVLVDAVSGAVKQHYSEVNPEDWSEPKSSANTQPKSE